MIVATTPPVPSSSSNPSIPSTSAPYTQPSYNSTPQQSYPPSSTSTTYPQQQQQQGQQQGRNFTPTHSHSVTPDVKPQVSVAPGRTGGMSSHTEMLLAALPPEQRVCFVFAKLDLEHCILSLVSNLTSISGPYHGDYIDVAGATSSYTSRTAGPNHGNCTSRLRYAFLALPSPVFLRVCSRSCSCPCTDIILYM